MARKTKQQPQRNKFIILTNGKRSEKNYLTALKDKQSIYDVTVTFSNTDPQGLVKQAVNLKTKQNFVWCVFDKDDFPSNGIQEAFKTARENGIGVAFSNISFEVWLLYHLKKFSNERTVQQLMAELDKRLESKHYNNGYSKADEKVIKSIFLPQINNALTNAKIVHQERIKEYHETHNDDNFPYCEWNSFTDVYRLVESLKLNGLR